MGIMLLGIGSLDVTAVLDPKYM